MRIVGVGSWLGWEGLTVRKGIEEMPTISEAIAEIKKLIDYNLSLMDDDEERDAIICEVIEYLDGLWEAMDDDTEDYQP